MSVFLGEDHLGTPQKMTSVSGAVVWSAAYDAFGKATVDAGSTVTNNLRFPGQYYDAETGMHYNYQRFYDPVAGRYVTEDPIGLDSEDENFYNYAFADPVNGIDPTGEVGFVGGGIGVIIEVSLQAYKNYKKGCNILDYKNYDWWDVGVSAAVGALGPGWLSTGKTTWRSGKAVKTLSNQLSRSRTANRAAKLEHRIAKHKENIVDALITQGIFQGAKALGKAANSNNDCACP